MSRRRHRRTIEKAQRHAPPRRSAAAPPVVVRDAIRVERLAYTRSQAAAALGISRSTLNRLLPFVEIVELPWGTKLIPADELERLVTERRRPARERPRPAMPGRRVALAPELVDRIHAERAAGKSFGQIARDLNSSGTPTAHGGAQWWSSTVRAVLRRRPSDAARLPFRS
jgi:hypothetical protein